MKLSTRTLVAWVGAMAIAVMAPLAHAEEIVNGGFEDGLGSSLSGWTSSTDVLIVDSVARTGSKSAEFPYSNGASSLSQAELYIDSAVIYDFEFYLRLDVLPCATAPTTGCFATDPGADFAAVLGGGSPLALSHAASGGGWVRYFAIFTGIGTANPVDVADTISLVFTYTPSSDFDMRLDDVSLSCARTNCERQVTNPNPMPEPGTLLLLGVALAAGALVKRRKLQA